MPFAAPRICCGKVIPAGQRCACQVQRAKENKARFDQARPTARQRGYDSKWEQARAAYLASHRTCVRCGAPATIVNHRIAHKGDMKLFWDRKNWEAVCKPCHDGPIQREEARGRAMTPGGRSELSTLPRGPVRGASRNIPKSKNEVLP
jgi:5-methylcytosine-specific restriction protein A